jgi:ABC-type transporter Mla MlaB component
MHDGLDSFRFQLEGRLTRDGARDLEQAWRTATSVIGERFVVVDLSRLTSIDASGRELLRKWQDQGARLVTASHQEKARLHLMTDRPLTVLKTATRGPAQHSSRTIPRWVAAFLVFLFPVSAANLKNETVTAWEDYVQAVNLRIVDRANAGRAFLWVDESPDRVAKLRRGEVVVSPAGPNTPREVPFGLIHDWMGAVFIANTTFDQVLAVVRDYERYKDFYRPAVIDSKPVALSNAEDRFSILLANKSLFRKTAIDSDYKSSQFRVDDRRRYVITQTTRIREIAEYGATSQHTLPEDQGTGLIWRLFGITRFEERDGGVYVEVEAIALSRDVPTSVRWLVEPLIRHVAKASLINSLQQTRDAVHSTSVLANRTVATSR